MAMTELHENQSSHDVIKAAEREEVGPTSVLLLLKPPSAPAPISWYFCLLFFLLSCPR